MARNLKEAEASKDSQLADAVRDSAREIWQAGLGAFEKARQEGSDVFAMLVKEGIEVQKRTQQLAEYKLSGMAESMSRMADSVGKQAAVSLEKIETMIEDRLARALNGLGVPTQADVKALIKQVAQLNKSVNALQEKRSATATPATKKAVAKTVRKPVAATLPKTTARGNGRQAVKKTAKAPASRV